MKNILKYTLFLLIVLHSNAQTPVTIVKEYNYNITGAETLIALESITLKPNTWIKAGSTFVAKIEPDAYRDNQFSNENYIFTRVFQTPINTASEITKNSDVIETITYLDGLGRPMQNIFIKASPTIKDIVTPISYDSIGRQRKEFLPYMDSSINLASYRNSALSQTNNYYTTYYPTDINNTKPNPFSEIDFEHSPLSRVMKQAAPGSDWAMGNGHEIKFEYQTNQENEVKQFLIRSKIGSELIDSKIYSSSYYLSGSLNKKIIKNENWVTSDGNNKTTQEFTDKEGQIVLKRTFGVSKVNGILTNLNHDTYYLYDEYGNLTHVIPPLTDTDALIKTELSVGSYEDYSKIFNHSVFSGTVSGGGSVTVTILNNVLKVVFSGGYDTSFLNTTPQDLLTEPCNLPDINLGTVSNGDYNASIENGKLKLTSITGRPSTGFSTTFTVNLPANCNGYRTVPDITILNNLCYQYKYDTKNRLVEKKLPGKDWEYIVYDKLDRPLLTQDANLRASNKWLFKKYDVFSRPVYTGEYVNKTNVTRVSVQQLADNSAAIFENKQPSVLNIKGTNLNYSNNTFPNSGIDLFTINYYDNYKDIDLDGGKAVSSYGITAIDNAKGLGTCSKIRILDTNNWTTSVSYYDSKGRLIYNYNKNNYLNVISTVKTQLDFVGKILETTNTHKKGSDALITITDSYSYDHAGRLLAQKQIINNQPQEVILTNKYDNLGQLINKGIGGKVTQSRLQNIDYIYNIRGWLRGINNVNAMGNNLFAFQINYNTPTTGIPLFNGNISQTSWRTANIDNGLKKYTYTYDDLSRLTMATDNSSINPGRYNEGLNYDKNGNIINILRLGHTNKDATIFGIMDNLSYSYDGGNKLVKIEDTSGSGEGFYNGSNTTTEYTYDANGNMITDANKAIKSITYNHLNLPTSVMIGNATINYTYDATGVKQRKSISTVTDGNTEYAGNFLYENNILKQFSQPEGYVAYNEGIFNYIYQYKDHLGNNRLSYQDKDNNGVVNSSEIIQENNYYAFGLTQKGYNSVINGIDNKYKYNGKELQDELGLNMYDYGARNYDPALGRWMNIDPLAEKSRRFNPYTYALNNPVFFIDPDGMEATDWFKGAGGRVVWFDSKSKGFTDTNGGKWTNVGATTEQVQQNMNIPKTDVIKYNSVEAFGTDGTNGAGKAGAALNLVTFKNTAQLDYSLNVENTGAGGKLISGKSEITGVNIDARFSTETWAPGLQVDGVAGSFGVKVNSPMGGKFTAESTPFKDIGTPMLSNAPFHATSEASLNVPLSTYSRLTNYSSGATGGALNLKFSTTAQATTNHGQGDEKQFNIGN